MTNIIKLVLKFSCLFSKFKKYKVKKKLIHVIKEKSQQNILPIFILGHNEDDRSGKGAGGEGEPDGIS